MRRTVLASLRSHRARLAMTALAVALGTGLMCGSFVFTASLTRSLDAPPGTVAAELYLDAIPAPRSSGHARSAFVPQPLQAVTRDFAFIVPAELAAETLSRAIRGADKAAITGVRLFDRFEAADGLSLAFEVTLQPVERSFTDEQIAEISQRIVAAGEKLGARLRS